jgi:hypothetical protein
MVLMRALTAIALVLLLALLGSIGFVYSGIYNVAATDPHWDLTHQILDTVRTRSTEAHAAGIKVPSELDNSDKLTLGIEHFAARCAVCHGGPGVPKGDIGKGLYPEPPDLRGSGEQARIAGARSSRFFKAPRGEIITSIS